MSGQLDILRSASDRLETVGFDYMVAGLVGFPENPHRNRGEARDLLVQDGDAADARGRRSGSLPDARLAEVPPHEAPSFWLT